MVQDCSAQIPETQRKLGLTIEITCFRSFDLDKSKPKAFNRNPLRILQSPVGGLAASVFWVGLVPPIHYSVEQKPLQNYNPSEMQRSIARYQMCGSASWQRLSLCQIQGIKDLNQCVLICATSWARSFDMFGELLQGSLENQQRSSCLNISVWFELARTGKAQPCAHVFASIAVLCQTKWDNRIPSKSAKTIFACHCLSQNFKHTLSIRILAPRWEENYLSSKSPHVLTGSFLLTFIN